MKLINSIFFFIAIALASCKPSPVKYKYDGPDTVAYTYKDFISGDTACANAPDSGCTIIKLKYPVFTGKRKALSDSITRKFIQLFDRNSSKTDSTQQQLAISLVNTYTGFKKAQAHSGLHYLLNGYAKVLSQDRIVMSIEVSGNACYGGAHDADETGYINWNLKRDRPITLDYVLDSGYRKPLTSIAEQLFRKNEKLSDTSSLNNGRTYFFKNGKFSLPDTYLLTNYGIKFLYNLNTIKPYAAGKTYLLVPYDHIRPLIKPHFGFTKNG